MDTNKNWTKSCTIIIMYYNSHYLSIFLIILFHQSGVIWSLQDDLSLYLFTLQGPVDRFREQRYRYWNFKNRKIEKFLRYGTKRERKKNRMKMNKMLSVHVSLVARPAVFLRRFNSCFAVVQFLSSSCWIIIIIQRIIIRNNKRSTKVWKKLDTEADTVVDCCRNWGEGHKQRHGQCANDRH